MGPESYDITKHESYHTGEVDQRYGNLAQRKRVNGEIKEEIGQKKNEERGFILLPTKTLIYIQIVCLALLHQNYIPNFNYFKMKFKGIEKEERF